MNSRKDIAAAKKRCGSHNCAQAIVATYCDAAGIDEATAMNLGNSFAAGMGNMEGTCGAIVGTGMVLGLASGNKMKSMQGMRRIMESFHARNGATQCCLLKGAATGKPLRSCPDCVADAAEFLEAELEKL